MSGVGDADEGVGVDADAAGRIDVGLAVVEEEHVVCVTVDSFEQFCIGPWVRLAHTDERCQMVCVRGGS